MVGEEEMRVSLQKFGIYMIDSKILKIGQIMMLRQQIVD